MSIQVTFFDMGGTLETFCYTRELRLQATPGLQKMLQSAGIDLHLQDEELYDVIINGLNRYHQWRRQSLEELSTQRIWREFVLAGYPIDYNLLDRMSEDLMVYIETRFYRRAMRPEVPGVLEAIKQMGIKIGLISNVASRGQVPKNLKEYGILHYFNPIVLSSEYGRRKPDPAIFHYAARLANVPTSKCAFVGDRVVRDIDGARRAGFGMAIQIIHNFDHGENDMGSAPDAILKDMTTLPEFLRGAGCHDEARIKSGIIRALIFDAGDILYFRPQRGRKFNAFLGDLSLDIDKNHDLQKKSLEQRAYRGQITQEQYWRAILDLYGVTQPDQIAHGIEILEEDDNDVSFFDGVRETLIALKKEGFYLGIVTDTAHSVHTKLSWFERGGFGDVWDSIISSKELGTRKPDPRIYLAALQQLGLTSDQAIFVGHKASELKGARAIGLKTVAFNYDQAARADYYIENFAELLTLPFVTQIDEEHS